MNPVKTMYGIFVVSKKNRIIIDVVGSGFLYHMVRNMAGALVDVGMGRKSSQRIEEILKGGTGVSWELRLRLKGCVWKKFITVPSA